MCRPPWFLWCAGESSPPSSWSPAAGSRTSETRDAAIPPGPDRAARPADRSKPLLSVQSLLKLQRKKRSAVSAGSAAGGSLPPARRYPEGGHGHRLFLRFSGFPILLPDVPEGIWRNAPAVQTTDGKGELRPCRRGNGSGGAGYRYGGGKQACCGRQFP